LAAPRSLESRQKKLDWNGGGGRQRRQVLGWNRLWFGAAVACPRGTSRDRRPDGKFHANALPSLSLETLPGQPTPRPRTKAPGGGAVEKPRPRSGWPPAGGTARFRGGSARAQHRAPAPGAWGDGGASRRGLAIRPAFPAVPTLRRCHGAGVVLEAARRPELAQWLSLAAGPPCSSMARASPAGLWGGDRSRGSPPGP